MMSQSPTMLFIGMDVHKDSTVFCIFDPSASDKDRYRYVTVPTTREGLESVLKPLAGRCKVAFEVGTQAQWVAAIVRPLATEVQIANPSMMPWLFRDGRKNDRMDARKLVTLLYLDQLPQVHLPSFEVSVWRGLINHRRGLIRALLRAQALRCPHKSLWTRKGQLWLASLEFHVGHKLMLDGLTDDLRCIEDKRVKIEEQLNAIALTQPAITMLRTIPGIGPRSAEAIVAYADDIRRFDDRKKFASYFGMTPTQDSSGLRDRHGHISKRGPSVVRWVLVEALHQVVRNSRVFRVYFERIQRGKKDRYKKAIVATGRKLLTIAFAMLRDGTPFDPARIRGAAA